MTNPVFLFIIIDIMFKGVSLLTEVWQGDEVFCIDIVYGLSQVLPSWMTGTLWTSKSTVVEKKSVVGMMPGTAVTPLEQVDLAIYISNHCPLCAYAYIVAAEIRRDFPTVKVCLVNLNETEEAIPEAVFATPTYLLNGRVWSLGNPSPEKINATFRNFPPNIPW